ncbi:hypothetical protein ACOSQ4_005166 [Xanthoceras sorbifolium]
MPANLMVRDLMNASRGWNSALIKSNFLSIDANAILGLPPPSCLHPVSLLLLLLLLLLLKNLMEALSC